MSSHPPFFANAQVMPLDPAEIFVPTRIGFYHEDKATALGRLIAVDGQRDPIKVQPRGSKGGGKQPWTLVTGLHRLRGCEMEGIQVFALEVHGQAEDLADLEASASSNPTTWHAKVVVTDTRGFVVHEMLIVTNGSQ